MSPGIGEEHVSWYRGGLWFLTRVRIVFYDKGFFFCRTKVRDLFLTY